MSAVEKVQWQRVCARADLVQGSGVCALVDGEQVALFYPGGPEDAVFGLHNRDPIGGANVLSRGIISDIGGRITVASPLYKQHYDLRSGQCLEDDTVRVQAYAVRIEGDDVLVGR